MKNHKKAISLVEQFFDEILDDQASFYVPKDEGLAERVKGGVWLTCKIFVSDKQIRLVKKEKVFGKAKEKDHNETKKGSDLKED